MEEFEDARKPSAIPWPPCRWRQARGGPGLATVGLLLLGPLGGMRLVKVFHVLLTLGGVLVGLDHLTRLVRLLAAAEDPDGNGEGQRAPGGDPRRVTNEYELLIRTPLLKVITSDSPPRKMVTLERFAFDSPRVLA